MSMDLPELFSIAGEASSFIGLPESLLFLILKASFLVSSTTPISGIVPNNCCIPVCSLIPIPIFSSSTIFRISFGL